MKKRIRMLSLTLSLCCLFSHSAFAAQKGKTAKPAKTAATQAKASAKPATTQAKASEAKAATYDPQDSFDRLMASYDFFTKNLETTYYVAESEEDIRTLMNWNDYLPIVMEQVAVSYNQAMIAEKAGNESFEVEDQEFSTRVTEDKFTLHLRGPNTYGDDPTPYPMGEYTEFFRKRNIMNSHCYFLDEGGQYAMTISYLDGALGKQYIYIQRIEYSAARDEAGKEDCYRAVRMMCSESKVMASATFLTLEEANKVRIRSVYKDFESFAFPGSETYVLDGDKVTVTTISGREVEYASSKDAPEWAKEAVKKP